MKIKHLIEPSDLSLNDLEELFKLGEDIIKDKFKYSNICNNYILSTLFYEPSTRTRFSFESAMLRLGGKVVGFSEPNSSSVAKGESIKDTIRTVSCYADIAVIRHPKEGAPKVASMVSDIPVINAGDGGHNHPTQTLTDLFTIKNIKGHLDNLKIGLCGDLKFGRTVHSLVKTIILYPNISFVFMSPKELQIPGYIKDTLKDNNISYVETDKLENVINELDVLYMTRIQKERFSNDEDYLKLKDVYILNKDKLKNAKKDMIIMHPLPRVNEINENVDSDERAVYFKQMKYGMYIRMALIIKMLGLIDSNTSTIETEKKLKLKTLKNTIKCKNPRCITSIETNIDNEFVLVNEKTKEYRCIYCDDIIKINNAK